MNNVVNPEEYVELTPVQMQQELKNLELHKVRIEKELAKAIKMDKFINSKQFKELLDDFDKERLAVSKRLHLKQAKEGGVDFLVGLACFEEAIGNYSIKIKHYENMLKEIEADTATLNAELGEALNIVE